MTGTIKTILESKGYGFIASPQFADDIFFHCTALESDLNFDETLVERRVEFNVIETPRGPKAACVRGAT